MPDVTRDDVALARIVLADSLLGALIADLPRAQRRDVLAGIVLDACCDRGWRKRLAAALDLGRLAHSPRKEG